MTLFTSCLSPTVHFVCLWPFHVLFTAYSSFCVFMAISRLAYRLQFILCVYGPLGVLFIAYSILCVFFACYFPLHFPLCVSAPFYTSCLSPTVSFVCLWPFSRVLLISFYIAYSLLCAFINPFTSYFSLTFSFVCLWPCSHIVYCLQCPFSEENERHCTDIPSSSTCTGLSRSGRLGHRGQCGLLFLCPHRSSRASDHFGSVPF